MRVRLLAPVLILFSLASPALAWAPEGQQIVAAIALRELTPAARARVAALLGADNVMVLDSSWADEIRQQRPETTAWHYVNIEIGSCGYDAASTGQGGPAAGGDVERDISIAHLSPRQAHGEDVFYSDAKIVLRTIG
jgi:hypothetical protein